MNRHLRAAIALVVALNVAGCATRGAVSTPRAARPVVDDPLIVQQFVSKLPVGSKVTVRLTSGEKLTAMLMVVDAQSVVLKPKTRVPEPARTVPINTIVSIEPAGSGLGAGKAILAGAAAGAATFFGFLLWAILVSD